MPKRLLACVIPASRSAGEKCQPRATDDQANVLRGPAAFHLTDWLSSKLLPFLPGLSILLAAFSRRKIIFRELLQGIQISVGTRMSNSAKSVFDAAQLIGKALDGLSPEDQQKALNGAIVMLGLGKSDVSVSPGTEGGSASGGQTDTGSGGGDASSAKRKSLVEYLNERAPATNAQRIAVFAAYREEVESFDTFAKDDLEKCFPKAKLAAPAYFNRDYNSAVSEGWIHDDGANSYLTQTGQKAVAAGFGGKGKPRGKAVGKATGKKGKAEE
ncbi:MAG: hypothetical protein SFU86_18390 [Pirellulaceae bacterium]|nr:hypothetical protein [Pirellulaceae bacterium]